MALYNIVDQFCQTFTAARHGEVLHGADAEVATRHSCQDGAGFEAIAIDRVTAANGCQRPRRGHTEGVHRFGQQILSDHGSYRRAAVTTTRIGRRARTF